MPGCINNTGSRSRPPRVLLLQGPSPLQGGTRAITSTRTSLSAPHQHHHHHGVPPTYRSTPRSSSGLSMRRSGCGLVSGVLSGSAAGCYYRTMLSLLVLGFYLTERREGMTAAAAAHPGGGTGTYRTDYVDESCLCSSIPQSSCDSFTLSPITNGAGHVALSRGLNLHTQFSCKFTIVAPPHQMVQVVINNISIPETRDCKAGILRVYDGIPGNGGWELTRACGDTAADRVVRSKTNQVTLYYYQGADILWDPKAFNITYTYVHEHRPDQLCNETSEYLCANKLCISRTLKCDGYDNCGDRSEELMDVHVCGSRYNKSDPVVAVAIGSVVGVVLAISLLTAFAYWARRRAGPLFTDAHLHRNEDNGEGEDQVEQPSDTRPPATAYLSVPDLTRDLIDRPRNNPNNEPSAAQSDLSPLDAFADQGDGPPPSYSSLFPDLV